MNKTEIGVSIIAMVAVGIATLFGFSVHETRQVNKKIGKAAEDLKNASVKDISDAMVQQAIEKAAEQAVSVNVAADNSLLLNKAKNTLESRITSLVNGAYDSITDDVGKRIAEQTAKLDDPERLKTAVRKRAEDILVSEFRGDLYFMKNDARDKLDELRSDYEDKFEEAVTQFRDDLDDKLQDLGESLQSMKHVYDVIGDKIGSHSVQPGGIFFKI